MSNNYIRVAEHGVKIKQDATTYYVPYAHIGYIQQYNKCLTIQTVGESKKLNRIYTFNACFETAEIADDIINKIATVGQK